MMYLSKEGSDDPLNLFIHYNRLQHGRKQYDNPKHNVVFGMKDICESTTRPINLIKDIYLSRSEVSDLKETSLIMKLQIKKEGVDINSVDRKHMPGQLHIGDITSDGFPDLILTLKKDHSSSGETEVHIL